jgi:CHAT domain-containing protein/Tfp pilus assembly protein PilF
MRSHERVTAGASRTVPGRALAALGLAGFIIAAAAAVLPAGQIDDASSLLAQADARAAEGTKASLEEAIALYGRALKGARTSAAPGVQSRALLGQGIALTWLTRPPAAVSALTQARTLLQKSGDPAGEAEALTFLGVAERFRGNHSTSLAAFEEALVLARQAGARRVEALALNSIGWAAAEPGRLTVEDKRAALEAAIAIQRELPDRHDLSMSLSGLGLVTQGTDGPKAAIPIYEEALAVAKAGQSPRAMGQALSLLGYAHSVLGDFDKAIAFYRDALPLTRLAGHRIQEPYTLEGLARLLYRRGRAGEALEHFKDALRVWQELEDPREGYSWHNVGVLLSQLGRDDEALMYYERALESHRARNDRKEEANTLLALASQRGRTGDAHGALRLAESALALHREVNDEPGERADLNYIGLSLWSLGRYREAIQTLDSALQRAQKLGSPVEEVTILRSIGTLYAVLGERRTASTHLHRALEISERAGLVPDEVVSLTRLASVHTEFGELDSARALLDRAAARARETDIPIVPARILDALAELALKEDRPDEALRHLNEAQAARRRAATELDAPSVFVNMGRAHRALGNAQDAANMFHRALTGSRNAASPETEAVALVELMRLRAQEEQTAVAAFHGKQAINLFQTTRGDLARLDLALQRAYADARALAYRDLADILVASGRLLEAQRVLDLLKEQEFFDFVRRQGPAASGAQLIPLTPAESAAASQSAELKARLAAIGRERALLLANASRTPAEESRAAELERELAAGNEEFARFMRELQERFAGSPAMAARLQDLTEAQGLMEDLRELEDGTVALYTVTAEDRFHVILITPDARVAGTSEIRVADLNRRVLAFRQALDDPRVDPRPLAQELYRILLEPVAPALEAARARTLLWSLDGTLRYIPVAALHDGTQYLVERYRSVVFTPASHSRLKDVPLERWRGIGVGVSRATGDFAALPAVTQELRTIFRGTGGSRQGLIEGRVLLDEAFTADAFRAGLRERRPVVHVASHFRFQPGDETDSFLLLGDGSRLTLDELRTAPNIFGGVELLVLSACNTAVGDSGATGAEVEGFAVLAQRQGAKAVMASLWPVADASTRLFMEAFYRARLRRGTTKAEALRQAQLALLRGAAGPAAPRDRGLKGTDGGATTGTSPVTGSSYSHPYYWAPFILLGNPR